MTKKPYETSKTSKFKFEEFNDTWLSEKSVFNKQMDNYTKQSILSLEDSPDKFPDGLKITDLDKYDDIEITNKETYKSDGSCKTKGHNYINSLRSSNFSH